MHGRASTYTFTDGVINTQPHIGSSAFTQNNATYLPEPRAGIAWSPFRNTNRTVIRAGFGMYNDLQDALGYRTDQNAPFNPTYSLPSLAVTKLPVLSVPSTAKLVPGGVQPDLQTPTLLSWSFRVEQEIAPNTVLRVGYVGSHGYHEILGIDANEPFPVICPASPCPAVYPSNFSGWDCRNTRSHRHLLCSHRHQAESPRSPTHGPIFRKPTALTTLYKSTSITASAAGFRCAEFTPGPKASMMATR